jgi:hypothetical protein
VRAFPALPGSLPKIDTLAGLRAAAPDQAAPDQAGN